LKEYVNRLRPIFKHFIPDLVAGRSRASLKFLILGSLDSILNKGEGYEQKKLLSRERWDVLVVLDACRYDYFYEEYEDFLNGELIKAYSPASSTTPWLKKVFNGFYTDIKIFSATPWLNSKGVEVFGYNPIDHFPSKNIADLWDYKWNEYLRTVHPKDIVEEVLNSTEDSKRKIIWFMQPHSPWIGKPRILISSSRVLIGADEAIVPLIKKGEISLEKLRKAYRGNLRLVLKYVSKLTEETDSGNKIIVTSDHGELLGEYNSFGHFFWLTSPELREVPFMIIQK